MHTKIIGILFAVSGFGDVYAVGGISAPGAEVHGVAESLIELVRKLGDESFRVREEATRRIWDAGESAVPVLRDAQDGEDPEVAHRASELLWKIELAITPGTEPKVIEWIDRYPKAQANEKIRILNQLIRARAWKQILKLYAGEKNTDVRGQFQQTAQRLALLAARESLLNKDSKAAKDYLEMAPNDSAGLMALADFHRSQQTLDEELQRAKTLPGDKGLVWQVALHRAAGNIPAATTAAEEAGQSRIVELLKVLQGDPLPWLMADLAAETDSAAHKAYLNAVVQKWEGRAPLLADLDLLRNRSLSKNQAERETGIHLLFLLGLWKEGEMALAKHSPFGAFQHMCAAERVDDALKILNLRLESPEFSEWIKKRIEYLALDREDGGENENELSSSRDQLLAMAGLLEQKGHLDLAYQAFKAPAEVFAREHGDSFVEFIADLVGRHFPKPVAPFLASRLIQDWAGDDKERWRLAVETTFGDEQAVLSFWSWLEKLAPTSSETERFEALLALHQITPDPEQLREKWLKLAWDAVSKMQKEEKIVSLGLLSFLANESGARGSDAAFALKVWDTAAELGSKDENWTNHVFNLAAADRWDEASEFFLEQIHNSTSMKQEVRPVSYAYAAACLRLAKRNAEADVYDTWVEQLALGQTEVAIQIGHAYAFGRQFSKAHSWWMRAAVQCDPDSEYRSAALQLLAEGLYEAGQWKKLAAVEELHALSLASYDQASEDRFQPLRARVQADSAFALELLNRDPKRAESILEQCHKMLPSDGSLADRFFPSLRKEGLLKLHDRLFDDSWKLVLRSIEQYPADENLYNNAGWLASRAKRNLESGEKLLKKALLLNPNEAAYLDSMAEIYFAMGNRAKSLEWSNKAVNHAPQDPMIRRQHERFRSEPFPP